eukprot:UC1_evm1s874
MAVTVQYRRRPSIVLSAQALAFLLLTFCLACARGQVTTISASTIRANCSDPLVADQTCYTTAFGTPCTAGKYCPFNRFESYADYVLLFLNDHTRRTTSDEESNSSSSAMASNSSCNFNNNTLVLECECPYGFYCPTNTSAPQFCFEKFYCRTPSEIASCPRGHFCREGFVEPFACSPLSICPAGSEKPRATAALVLFAVLVIVVGLEHLVYTRVVRIRKAKQDAEMAAYLKKSDGGTTGTLLPGSSKPAERSFSAWSSTNSLVQSPRSSGDLAAMTMTKSLSSVPGVRQLQSVNSIVEVDVDTLSLHMGDTSGKDDDGLTVEFNEIGLTLPDGHVIMEGVTEKTAGVVRVNGAEVEGLQRWRQSVGYVPQEDVMHRRLTVHQNILFAARARLPAGTPAHEVEERVRWIISTLGLAHVQHSIIGDETARGISGGQRKRVNIGLELAADPKVLFLDEPTSGLDSATSNDLCQLMRDLAEGNNMTVVAVIHSPSPKAFAAFHDFLLLQPGGRTVYTGPIIGAEDFAHERLGYEAMKDDEAPAEYLLNVASNIVKNRDEVPPAWATVPGASADTITPADYFAADAGLQPVRSRGTVAESVREEKSLGYCARAERMAVAVFWVCYKSVASTVLAVLGWFWRVFTCAALRREFCTPDDKSSTRKTPGYFTHFIICFKRALTQIFGDTRAFAREQLAHFGLGLFLSITSVNLVFLGPMPYEYCVLAVSPAFQFQCLMPQKNMFASTGNLICWGVTFAAIAVSVNTFGREQTVYWREASGGLRSLPYYLAKTSVDFVRIFAASLFFLAGFLLFFPNNAGTALGLWEVILLLYIFGFAMGWGISFFVPTTSAPLVGVAVALAWSILFSGVQPSLSDVQTNFGPSLSWIWDLSVPRWAIEYFYLGQIGVFTTVSEKHPAYPAPYMNTTTALSSMMYSFDDEDLAIGAIVGLCIGWVVLGYIFMISSHNDKKK